MWLFYTDVFVLPLPPGHRFPMEKYARLRAALLASGDELAQAHDPAYIAAVSNGQLDAKAQKAIGFP